MPPPSRSRHVFPRGAVAALPRRSGVAVRCVLSLRGARAGSAVVGVAVVVVHGLVLGALVDGAGGLDGAGEEEGVEVSALKNVTDLNFLLLLRSDCAHCKRPHGQ